MKKANIVNEAKEAVKSAKQPKTVRVSTLVKIGIFIVVIVAVFIAGYQVKAGQDKQYEADVQATASKLVSTLK